MKYLIIFFVFLQLNYCFSQSHDHPVVEDSIADEDLYFVNGGNFIGGVAQFKLFCDSLSQTELFSNVNGFFIVDILTDTFGSPTKVIIFLDLLAHFDEKISFDEIKKEMTLILSKKMYHPKWVLNKKDGLIFIKRIEMFIKIGNGGKYWDESKYFPKLKFLKQGAY